LLVPVNCRRQLLDLSDDMATKVDIQFYSDARDALLRNRNERSPTRGLTKKGFMISLCGDNRSRGQPMSGTVSGSSRVIW
jgi:hypothetical protein